MPFPIISPAFYKELVDVKNPKPEDSEFCDVYISAAAVEYVMHLSNVNVVKKLIETTEPLAFKMAYLGEEDEDKIIPISKDIIRNNPLTEYYWQIRTLMMSILQNKEVVFEKRMLLLNYAMKTIHGMADKHQPEHIPEFINSFTEKEEYDSVLEYFSEIRPAPHFSLSDGISLLKSLSKKNPAYKDVLSTIYKNLGVSGPETLNLIDMKKYLKLRADFANVFMMEKSHFIENIMINYVWTYSLPFAPPGKLSIWENYVFFCSLYNAIKILITCYMPGKTDDDFAKAISAFDDALRQSGNDIIWKLVAAAKNAGQDNNGDLAILVVS